MKRTNMLTAIAVLFCATLVMANAPAEVNPKAGITEQLQKILSDNALSVDKEDATARVLFKVNAEGAIEILEIAADRKDVKWFIDRKLDGKTIAVDKDVVGEVFVVDVRVTS